MAESMQVISYTYALGDPGADNKQLYLLRAPSAAMGGGITILSGEVVQGGTVTNSLGVGGTTFTVALHKYTNAATPALYGTVAASVGGTALGWGAGVPDMSRRGSGAGRSIGVPLAAAAIAGSGPAQASTRPSSPFRNRWQRTPPV